MWKRLAYYLLLPTLLVAGLLGHHHRTELSREAEHAARLSREIVDAQRLALQQALQTVASELRYLALRPSVQAWGRDPTALAADFHDLVRLRGIYQQVRVIDRAGRERVRVNWDGVAAEIVADAALQEKGDRYYLEAARGLGIGEVYVSPFDLNVEQGQIERPLRPVIRFLTPIPGTDGAPSALLVFNYLGQSLLDAFDRATREAPGEVHLLDATGRTLHGDGRAETFGVDPEARLSPADPATWALLEGAATGQRHTASGLQTWSRVEVEPAASALLIVSTVSPGELRAAALARMQREGLAVGVGWILLVTLAVRAARADLEGARAAVRLADSERGLRRLSALLLEAQEAERRRISRDLHDEVAQILTVLSLKLQRAQRTGPAGTQEQLGAAVVLVDSVLVRLDAVVSSLRSSLLQDLGLAEALEELGRGAGEGGPRVQVEVELEGLDLDPAVQVGLYRIAQEALTNALRHGRPRAVTLSLNVADAALLLRVADDGIGFHTGPDRGITAQSRLGLLGMRERAIQLGGDLRVVSRPGGGTVVTLHLPLPGRTDV